MFVCVFVCVSVFVLVSSTILVGAHFIYINSNWKKLSNHMLCVSVCVCFFLNKNNASCSRSLKERVQYMFFLIFASLCFFPQFLLMFEISIFNSIQIKPLHDAYLSEVSSMIWEQLNRFWAESYEACKASSQKRAKNLMESRRKFQVSKSLISFRIGKWHRK